VLESDAITKWCPYVRVSTVNGNGPTNRDTWFIRQPSSMPQGSLDPRFCCIGSMCMAWRNELPDGSEGYCGALGGRSLPL
jgi:hypothetical protein